ncbi:hypothetical protein DO97_10455 [Neosynechococcus sphagnicola sy1]|uniref:DUF3177 domain-containing protein n=1 Tax=Neosynechococcus sphagnicola sy1 TaxID=1497020 RepID=A0A098TNH8_9CYAN|nr:DUF3177 family protein [Neosynechococcus sphagnicola]KGF73816.1 hypothetical protein DO97_10455 [Neosynechococcus sphagnicola sy1]
MQSELWLRSLVWTDYRLAVLFTVTVPLVLLVWAFVRKAEAIQKLLVIYWRVASLLVITLYLMIAALPISFISALLAQILIPLGLWFWADLNEEIREQPKSPLKFTLLAWRWAMTVYFALGAIAQVPFLSCAVTSQTSLLDRPFCRVWLEAPWGFKALFHAKTTPQFLGFLGIVGLVIYVLYLGHFVLYRLGKQGRSATIY